MRVSTVCLDGLNGNWIKENRSSETLRPDSTSKLVRELAFRTPQFYIAPYDKIKHELVNYLTTRDENS